MQYEELIEKIRPFELSVISSHIKELNHIMDWEGAIILDRKSNFKKIGLWDATHKRAFQWFKFTKRYRISW